MKNAQLVGSARIVSVKEEPGLFDALTEITLDQVQRFVWSTGIAVPSVSPMRLESGHLRRIGKNVLRQIRDFFSSARVIDTFELPISIPAAELHCPKIATAVASVAMGTSASTTKSSVGLLAIGGGLEYELEVEEGWAIETGDGQCVRVTYEMPARWERCEIADLSGKMREFVRLTKVLGHGMGTRPNVLGADDDVCLSKHDATKSEPVDLTALTTGKMKKVLKIAAHSKWSGKAKITAPGVELSAEYSAKRKNATAWEYVLPAGHSYSAMRLAQVAGWSWNLLA